MHFRSGSASREHPMSTRRLRSATSRSKKESPAAPVPRVSTPRLHSEPFTTAKLRIDQLEEAPDHLLKRPETGQHYDLPDGHDQYAWPPANEKAEPPKANPSKVARARCRPKTAAETAPEKDKGDARTVCLQYSPSLSGPSGSYNRFYRNFARALLKLETPANKPYRRIPFTTRS